MHSTGHADREPLKLSGNVGLYKAGAVATMAAVLAGSFSVDHADVHTGHHIDVYILETQLGPVDRRANVLSTARPCFFNNIAIQGNERGVCM